jgi:hypothetical protein
VKIIQRSRTVVTVRPVQFLVISMLMLLVLGNGASPLFAQVDRGTIVGAVTDSSGAVVPDAKVQVVNINTNATTDLLTNSAGLYTAPNLPLATYRVVFQKSGFGQIVREPIEIRAGSEIRVDATLTVGNTKESVTVSTEAPLVDVASMSNAAGFPAGVDAGVASDHYRLEAGHYVVHSEPPRRQRFRHEWERRNEHRDLY